MAVLIVDFSAIINVSYVLKGFVKIVNMVGNNTIINADLFVGMVN